ncbi:hypothetical protein BFR57_02485 [Idiomarina sp. MD25a]|nr:hypothetical protein BFR57_02485 [Idiomarina sp. MD25a]
MDAALKQFKAARQLYVERRFAEAFDKANQYRRFINYTKIKHEDRRRKGVPTVSIIIVLYRATMESVGCIEALCKQAGATAEVIVVDNGFSKKLYKFIRKLPVLLIRNPINFGPSEARNIGAFFARGTVIAFVDDDSEPSDNFVESAIQSVSDPNVIGARGRILKGGSGEQSPHYDLGDYVQEASFNLEGNMTVRRDVFFAAGGFDLLMFGHEGHELAERMRMLNHGKSIVYWPELVISHDFPTGASLKAKRERQATGMLYREYRRCTYAEKPLPSLPVKIVQEGFSFVLRNPTVSSLDEQVHQLRGWAGDVGIELLIETDASTDVISSKLANIRTEFPVTLLKFKTNTSFSNQTRLRYPNVIVIEGSFLTPSISWITIIKVLNDQLIKHADLTSIFGVATYFESTQGSMLGSECAFDELFIQEERRVKREKALERRNAYPSTLENTLDELSNRIIHQCPYFNDESLTVPRSKRPYSLKVGFIGSNELYAELNSLCKVTMLVDSEQKDPSSYDVLITESVLSSALQEQLLTSVSDWQARFSSEGKPSIFWFTESSIYIPVFADLITSFDHLFVSNKEAHGVIKQTLGIEGQLTDVWIAPRINNQIKHIKKPSFSNLNMLYDGWADTLHFSDNRELIANLLPHGVHIAETKWEFNQRRLTETPELQRVIIGCLNEHQFNQALKEFRVALFTSQTLRSPEQQKKQILKALAAKTNVFYFAHESDESRITELLGGLLPYVEVFTNVDLLAERFEQLKREPWLRKLNAQKAWRYVMTYHCLENSLNEVLHLVKRDSKPQAPRVSCITVTKRPELVDTIIANFKRQTYPDKELLVALNCSGAEFENFEHKLKSEVKNVKVYQLGSERNIGFCLNWLIRESSGEFWAKLDDDDEYGLNYIFDYVLNTRAADLDIIGKKMGPTYFEASNETLYRDPSLIEVVDTLIYPGNQVHLAGATFFGRKSLLDEVPFSESLRASVDVDFLERAQAFRKRLLLIQGS